MDIIFLAAGLGTRMGRLAYDCPKPLVKVTQDRSILDVNIDRARTIFPDGHFLIIGGYKYEYIEAYVESRRTTINISSIKNHEFATRGPLVSLLVGLENSSSDTLIFGNGDTTFSRRVFQEIASSLTPLSSSGIFLCASRVSTCAADDVLAFCDENGGIVAARKVGGYNGPAMVSAGLVVVRGFHAKAIILDSLRKLVEEERCVSQTFVWHSLFEVEAVSAIGHIIAVDRDSWKEFDTEQDVVQFRKSRAIYD